MKRKQETGVEGKKFQLTGRLMLMKQYSKKKEKNKKQ